MVTFVKKHPYLITVSLTVLLLVLIFFLFITNLFYIFLSKIQTRENNVNMGNLAIIQMYGIIDNDKVFNEIFRKCREKKNIKAVILHINSAGGSVGPSQEVYREILLTSKKKPVFVSIRNTAASGGYYIASASDYIFSNNGSLIGSIGVITNLYNLENLLKNVGINSVVIKNGKYKDIGSTTRKITKEECDLLQEISNNIYFQFLRDVAYRRSISLIELEKIANGKIYTGEQAASLNLVDKIGTLNEVINYAGSKLNITDKLKPIHMNLNINFIKFAKNILSKSCVNNGLIAKTQNFPSL